MILISLTLSIIAILYGVSYSQRLNDLERKQEDDYLAIQRLNSRLNELERKSFGLPMSW